MSGRIGRRDFIAGVGVAAIALAWPRAARAQPAAMPVIGFLNPTTAETNADRLRAFRQGLRDAGYAEGQNIAVDYRWAENRPDQLPALAADLVRRNVALIVATGGTVTALAAKAATTTIPIVFSVAEDPVRVGIVASLARPGGNATGVNFFTAELGGKRLELLRELLPDLKRVAVLVNPAGPAVESTLKDVEAAARVMNLQIRILNASTSREIDGAFASFAQQPTDALFVAPEPFFLSRRFQLALLAARHALPATYALREYVDVGGLMSYGTDIADAYRETGVYVGRVLKGAKPADMPVIQSSKFTLAINAQTARILGVTVPPALLARADEVIE